MRTSAPTTETVGPFESTFDREAWGYYEELRRLGDVVRDEEHGTWLVTSYDLIRQMTRDDQVVWRSMLVYDEEHPPFGLSRRELTEFMGAGHMGLEEGEAYDRIHRWFLRVFSPKVLADWGDRLIEPIAHTQIDRFAGRGRAELVAELCERITPRVMTAVLGLPWSDDAWYERFMTLHRTGARQLFAYQHGSLPSREVVDTALRASREMRELMLPVVEAKQGGDGNDLISLIWSAGEELFGGRTPTAYDVTVHAQAMFRPGTGSIATVAANGLYLLATRPEVRAEIAHDPRATRNFVEETLRLYGQLEFRPRRAKQDTELGGVPIKRGELVVAVIHAANRDPVHYEHPAAIDLDRPAPRDHFGFYLGPRTCPGQSLARFQLERIFTVVVERLAGLRLDPAAEPPQWRGRAARRWEPIHVLFESP